MNDMKSIKTDNDILNILHEYEALPEMELSPDWHRSLMSKIGNAKQQPTTKFRVTSLSALIYIIILINAAIIIKEMTISDHNSAPHNTALQTISKELLINPMSNSQ
jgi:hypothetical protein